MSKSLFERREFGGAPMTRERLQTLIGTVPFGLPDPKMLEYFMWIADYALAAETHIAFLTQQRAEIAEAIAPFAKVAEVFEKTGDDALVPWGTPDATRIDLFRASAVTRDAIRAGDMRRLLALANGLSREARGEDDSR